MGWHEHKTFAPKMVYDLLAAFEEAADRLEAATLTSVERTAYGVVSASSEAAASLLLALSPSNASVWDGKILASGGAHPTWAKRSHVLERAALHVEEVAAIMDSRPAYCAGRLVSLMAAMDAEWSKKTPEAIDYQTVTIRSLSEDHLPSIKKMIAAVAGFRNLMTGHVIDGKRLHAGKQFTVNLASTLSRPDFLSLVVPVVKLELELLLDAFLPFLRKYHVGTVARREDGTLVLDVPRGTGQSPRLIVLTDHDRRPPVVGETWLGLRLTGDIFRPIGPHTSFESLYTQVLAARKSSDVGWRPPPVHPEQICVEEGTFVPVIGPDFARCLDADSAGARHIQRRVAAVAAAFDGLGIEREERQRHDVFLKAVCADYAPQLRVLVEEAGTLTPMDRTVAPVVVRVLVAARFATEAFGRAMSQGIHTVAAVELVRVWLPEGERDTLDAMLRDAITAVADLLKGGGRPEYLGLGEQLLPGLLERVREHLAHLPLASVEWLTDLAWHFLRFDAPFYPDPTELALQINLCAVHHGDFRPGLRRATIGTAALVNQPDYAVAHLQSWLRHRLLVASVHKVRDRYDVLVAAIARVQERLATRANSALAIDSNFDGQLVAAFERSKHPHRLVFPIKLRYPEGPQGRWAVRRWHPAEGERWSVLSPNARPVRNQTSDGIHLAEEEAEPIVVALNGAPLLNLEPLERAIRYAVQDTPGTWAALDPFTRMRLRDVELGDTLIEHRVVLSDHDILRELLVTGTALHSDIRAFLHQPAYKQRPRSLWFLGYGVAEFGRRIRIFADTQHGYASDDLRASLPAQERRYVPHRQVDDLTRAYLEGAGIRVVQDRTLATVLDNIDVQVRPTATP